MFGRTEFLGGFGKGSSSGLNGSRHGVIVRYFLKNAFLTRGRLVVDRDRDQRFAGFADSGKIRYLYLCLPFFCRLYLFKDCSGASPGDYFRRRSGLAEPLVGG